MSYSRVLKLARVFPEGLFALLAYEGHVKRLHERMVALLLVAFCAVVPLLACPFSASIQCCSLGKRTAGRADGDLGVEDVFAACASASCGGHSGGLGRSACLPHGGQVIGVLDSVNVRLTAAGC
jgi:hypothetical protein